MPNIRQYIGARYVFKIYENSLNPSSAEWEAGVTYEPLTIVTYQNSSYASKKDVPGAVGDPASNPNYWIVTGAYNGQIARLQSDVAALNAAIGDHSSGIIKSIDDVQAEVDDLNNNIIPGIDTQIQNIIDDMVDVQMGPGIYTGSTNVTDNDIHTVGSVTLEAGKLYMIYSKCDFEIAANGTSGEHYFEQEVSTIENPTNMGRSRVAWSGSIAPYTSYPLARVISVSNVWIVKPSVQTTVYLHIRDTKSASTSVTAYPSLQAINFD